MLRRFYLKLKTAKRAPVLALIHLLRGREAAVLFEISRVCQSMEAKPQDVDKYYESLKTGSDFYNTILRSLGPIYYGEITWCSMGPEALYIFTRILKPETVVETGVAAGVSSAFILKALEDNGKGILYSIDYPNYWEQDYLPPSEQSKLGLPPKPYPSLEFIGKETGFAIPTNLKRRWVLKLGKSRDLLANLLKELGKCDIFLHDSEHTYENMMFEYITAWDYLPQGGFLVSDEISWNSAFRDFSRKVGHRPIKFGFSGMGIIVK